MPLQHWLCGHMLRLLKHTKRFTECTPSACSISPKCLEDHLSVSFEVRPSWLSMLCLSTLQVQMRCHCLLQDAIASAQHHRPSTSAPLHQYFPPIDPEDNSQQGAGLAQATSNALG